MEHLTQINIMIIIILVLEQLSNITNNIVTLSSIGTPIYTYDVLNPQTTGGGVTAGTQYFIKKLSGTTFSLHAYNSSQDGSQGYINPSTGNYKVYDSIANDESSYIFIWISYNVVCSSTKLISVKEIIPNTIGETETYGHIKMSYWDTNQILLGTIWLMVSTLQLLLACNIHLVFGIEHQMFKVLEQPSHCTHTGWPSSSGTLTATAEWKKASWTATAPGSGGTNMYWPGVS